jgi:hypothetical protein
MLSTTSRAFLENSVIPTDVRDSIRTLLGPRPYLKSVPAYARIGSLRQIKLEALALIAYRAKIVALMTILEVGVKTGQDKPITRTLGPKLLAVRKPMATATAAKATKTTAAKGRINCRRWHQPNCRIG